ncbi:MAG: RimK family alpha-L-glutamate ligase [Ekhidna sp.]
MHDVIVLTDERYIDPTETNEYVNNILKEDQLVLSALEKNGLKAKKLAWSDTSFDWSSTEYILFRTTWDYAERFSEFSDWLLEVSTKTKLINPYDTIVWNMDKHYMLDLKREGVNIIETYFVESKDERTLKELHHELGWSKTVLKPAISAAAKDTYKLNEDNIENHESRYSELIKAESMMLQPFQNSVVEKGEISLMMMGGEFTHAVLKKAKTGDFRVQDDFGGTVHDYTPTQTEIDLAIAALNACNKLPLYARVDIMEDNNGNPAISELELIEPELWFRRNEEAAEILAKAIKELF